MQTSVPTTLRDLYPTMGTAEIRCLTGHGRRTWNRYLTGERQMDGQTKRLLFLIDTVPGVREALKHYAENLDQE